MADDGSGDNPLQSFLPPDSLVAYHGTSSAYAADIELAGLHAERAVWSSEECRAICAIFEALHWAGTTVTGYPVLGPWGPDRDIAISGQRHLYLAESYPRASIYANVPGGETGRATISCLEDLILFQTDDDLRQGHLARLEKELRGLGYVMNGSYELRERLFGALPYADELVKAAQLTRDIGWLEMATRTFQPLLDKLREVAREHQPVVYALRLEASILVGGHYSSSMGIEVTQPILPDRIIAKAFPAVQRESDRAINEPGQLEALIERDRFWEARMAEANGPGGEPSSRHQIPG